MSRFTLRLLLTTACFAPSALLAEEEAAVPETPENEAVHIDLDTIVVTGSPLQRPLGRTITAVSVLDREAIIDNLENSIGETLRLEPGISSTFFGAGSSRPIIRGLGGDRIRVLDNGVGTFDAAQTSVDHAVPVEPVFAERIEVVRGAASLLYGSSAAGGVVNVFSQRIPTERPENGVEVAARYAHSTVNDGDEAAGGATLAIGDIVVHGEGFWRETGNFDIPGLSASRFLIAEEMAEAAEEGEEFELDEIASDGFVENSDVQSDGGSGGASWLFDRGGYEGHIGFSGTILNTKYGIPPGAHEEGEEEGEEEEEEEEETIRIDLEQVRLDIDGEVRGDFAFFEAAKVRVGYGNYRHIEFESGETGTLFENDEVEGRLELVGKPMDALGGVIRSAYGTQVRFRDFSAIGDEAFVPPAEQTQVAFFALGEYTRGKFVVDASGRYERVTNETDTFVADEDADPIAVDRNFDVFSVSGGLGYAFTENLFAGANVFRTERAPSLEEAFAFGPHLATSTFEIGDPNLDEELARGVEGTIRGQYGPATLVLNAFYTNYLNFIFLEEIGTEMDGLPVFEFSAADAVFRGFEAELDLDFGGLDLPLLNRTEFSANAQTSFVRATTDDLADEDLPRIPPLSALFGLSMTSDLITLRGEVEYVSAQDNIASFELPTDDFVFLNAYLTVRPFRDRDYIAFDIRARNIGDEEGRVHSSFIKDFTPLPGRDVRFALRLAY